MEAVWLRAKFDRYQPESLRRELLSDFASRLTIVPTAGSIHVRRDPRDNKFLEVAVAGGADLILTGDADLLALHPFRGIAIVSPADYLANVGAV